MNEHDELCPDFGKHHNGMTITTEHCHCALIAKVRADEREKNTPLDIAAFRAKIVEAGQESIEAALADLRAKVEALEEHIVERGDLYVRRDDVLALFDGGTE
jgi:acetolactate synthase small subunit